MKFNQQKAFCLICKKFLQDGEMITMFTRQPDEVFYYAHYECCKQPAPDVMAYGKPYEPVKKD